MMLLTLSDDAAWAVAALVFLLPIERLGEVPNGASRSMMPPSAFFESTRVWHHLSHCLGEMKQCINLNSLLILD
jgi:hypothetical protein